MQESDGQNDQNRHTAEIQTQMRTVRKSWIQSEN